MKKFTVNLEDSTEPVQKVIHTVSIEIENETPDELRIVETGYDIHNSSYKFDDIDGADWVADHLGISLDDLMDACIDTIYKNGV